MARPTRTPHYPAMAHRLYMCCLLRCCFGSRLTFQLVPAHAVNQNYKISTTEVLGTGVGGEVVVGQNRSDGRLVLTWA